MAQTRPDALSGRAFLRAREYGIITARNGAEIAQRGDTMTVQTLLQSDTIFLLDGGMGTMLQTDGLGDAKPETAAITHRELVVSVHRAYVQAGARILCANTFGANRKKLDGGPYTLEEVIAASISAARKAAGNSALVALDVGPLGALMEPSGDVTFEEAYAQFAQIVQLGAAASADLVYIETMTDLAEARAALLAAKENTALPVFVTMSFEADGRTFTGCPIESAAVVLEGLGADAVGINCSLGPQEIYPIAQRLCGSTSLPVLIKPNAGLPDPASGKYGVDAAEFSAAMEAYKGLGVAAVGGCCGTTPAFIEALRTRFAGVKRAARPAAKSGALCSAAGVVYPRELPLLVGERINPTGKDKLKKAILSGDMAYVQTLASEQEQTGARLLDVNVGLPECDEAVCLVRAVRAVQRVSGLPLVLDSTDPTALEGALRIYCGKALVNSVNGDASSLNAILPLCRKYGAAVVGLCLDEKGIPASVGDRIEIARRIVAACDRHGIPREDIYIDTLTLPASMGADSAAVTLGALGKVKEELGVGTILGVSNSSFGLPDRDTIGAHFLTLALGAGLDLALVNTGLRAFTDAYDAALALCGKDPGAAQYIARRSGVSHAAEKESERELTLREAILRGLAPEAEAAARKTLQTVQGGALIDAELIPALDEIGEKYESGEIFLPTLLRAAEAAKAAFAAVRETMPASDGAGDPVVIATVRGDVHDIGKNIVGTLLANYGYEVIDLGIDVREEAVVEAARTSGAKLVGLSALMTTTAPAMKRTVAALREAGLACKIMVGGAVITEDYARSIGADYYAADAKRSADIAKEVYHR